MKKYVPLVFLMCLALAAPAQKKFKEKRASAGWLGVNAGISIPVSDYAMRSDDADAGIADPGINYRLDLGIRVYKNIGLLVTGLYGSNSINEDFIGQQFKSNVAVNRKVVSPGWVYWGTLGGFYCRLPGEFSPVYLKGQMGYLKVYSPKIDVEITTPLNPQYQYNFTQSSASSDAFLTAAGIGVNIPLQPSTILSIGVDYLSAKAKFGRISYSQTQTGQQQGVYNTIESSSQHLTMICINAGIAFNFN